MKNITFKKLLPHLIAIVVFLLVAVIFCKPALESDVVMQQGDITAADAMKHQLLDYAKDHNGTVPLWMTSMFSGMPAYQLLINAPWSPIGYINSLLQLGLPKPLNFFFLACICFYFLCMCLRIRPYVAILGSLAFAYCSFNPIIAVAGHDTELLALAYAPALIGSVILIFDRKYIAGFILTSLFAALHLMQNHQQISYYTFIIIIIAGLFYLVKWIKEKDAKHIAKVIPLTIGAALIGVCVNAVILFPVMDYAKYSKRGGQLAMDNKIDNKTNHIEKDKTVGLTREYAFQWSYGRVESLSLLFPGVTGYGTYYSQRDNDYDMFPKLDENSNVGSYLLEKLNVPEEQVDNKILPSLSQSIYWGDKPFTSGSVYLGASICFLFILGMFLLDGKHKWWIFTASVLGIILAMGKNLSGINNFFFDFLPLYNKFRTPEMALVIPQIVFSIMAVLTVEKLIDVDSSSGIKKLKSAAIATAVVFAIAGSLYFSLDYSKENKERTAAVNAAFATPDSSLYSKMQLINQTEKYTPMADNQVYENLLEQTKGDPKVAKAILTALHKDRQSFFGTDILHSLLFVILTIALIALYLYRKINVTILLIALPLLTVFDLVPFGMNYINDKSFESADKHQSDEFSMTDADKMILQDKDPNYRVYNASGGDPFQDARTSYYHKSIGGYHPAKLGIYDDLITYQLSGQPNPAVLNMLNTKYFIQKSQQGDVVASKNSGALGNCWFVKGVKFVETPVQEMKALDNFNPADTAVINSEYKNIITGFGPVDSLSVIKETSFDNTDIKYESNSNNANVAVFSEIYYKDWKAYIDGKETPIAKANYVLRALVIPAGKHTIEFKFEPKIYSISYAVSLISIWILVALLLWLGYLSFSKTKE